MAECVISNASLESGMAVHTWEDEAGGSRLQGQPELHTKFKAGFNYIADCFKSRQKCTPGKSASADGVGHCHYSACF